MTHLLVEAWGHASLPFVTACLFTFGVPKSMASHHAFVFGQMPYYDAFFSGGMGACLPTIM